MAPPKPLTLPAYPPPKPAAQAGSSVPATTPLAIFKVSTSQCPSRLTISVLVPACAAPLSARSAASVHDILNDRLPCPNRSDNNSRRMTRRGVRLSICPNLLADHPAKAARVERSRIPASFFRTQTLAQ